MIIIDVNKEQIELVKEYAVKQTLNGVSRLKSNDLNKASRLQYQYTGLYGESAWHLFRYNNLNKLKEMLDFKNSFLKNSGKGDGGKDDEITFRGITKQIDIKSSHSYSNEINHLNLIVPKEEFHKNTLYIATFTVGQYRENPSHVILAGWSPNEDIKNIWKPSEPNKFAVPVLQLRKIKILQKILENNERF